MEAILILAAVLLLFLYLLFFRKENKKAAGKKQQTTAELNNVKNIVNGQVQTFDQKLMQYIRIYPISVDLYSEREKENLTRELTNQLSQIPGLAFRFLAVSRPVDISGVINEHQELLQEAKEEAQREILKKEIAELARFALEGDVVERQFYFRVTGNKEKREEMKKKVLDICRIFNDNKIDAKICDTYEVIKLGNMIAHPQYVHLEENSIDSLIPMFIR